LTKLITDILQQFVATTQALKFKIYVIQYNTNNL